MGIRVKRFPEFGVELQIRSGAFTGEDLVRHFRSLDAADALRWIHYYAPTTDTSGIDLACLPELKRVVAAKQKELFGDEPPAPVVVSGSSATKEFFDFWRSLAETGDQRPTAPAVLFSTLEEACDWLGLTDAARKALTDAVKEAT